MKISARCLCLLVVLAAVAIQVGSASAQPGGPSLQLTFIGKNNITLADLARGATGRGVLLYYLPQHDTNQPTLAVRLSKEEGADVAKAEVFDAPDGFNYVPIG